MPGLDALAVGGGVTDPRDARHAVGGLLAAQGPTALDIRTGVLTGPGSTALITGTSKTGPKMSVLIGVHVGVGTRGTANGAYLGPTLDAPLEVDVDLAPASGSRIDVVWGRQRDTTAGVPTPDAAAGPEYGVLKGTSTTGTPAKPDLATLGPAGATELGTVTVAAGATSTNGAGVTITNTARQTVARGARIPVRSQAERDALVAIPGLEVYRLDTGAVELCTSIGPPAWRSTLPTNAPRQVVRTGANSAYKGTVYNGTAPLIRQTFWAEPQIVGGAGGWTYDFPEAFPNGLLALNVTLAGLVTNTAAPQVIAWADRALTTLATISGAARSNFTGTAVPAGQYLSLFIDAIGW